MLRALSLALLSACATPSEGPVSEPIVEDSGDSGVSDALARCDYENPFSKSPECKEYTGAGWDLDSASADCEAPVVGGSAGTLVEGQGCARDAVIGECLVAGGEELENTIVFPGTDPGACSGAEFGCSFAQGEWMPGEVCNGEVDDEGVPSDQAFVPFSQVCVDPLPEEPAGNGPDGQVCTWEAISGSTEEGRRFEDYASCEPIFTQRPYWSSSVDVPDVTGDPRLDDAEYMAELDWITEQTEASACVCCHSSELAPDGPSGWFVEAGPLWIDTLDDDGLAMMAGWVDSTAFGAFPAEDNNGFARGELTGMPSTDPVRARAFLEAELARRGLTESDFVDTAPFGGVLYDQLFHEPADCDEGVGMDAEGVVSWTGGPARYLYVLEADSMSPGVPPNLDTPEGTLWRLDVDHTADPLPSGVSFGDLPDGTAQAWPESMAPTALVSGETYYLVALLDIYQPATRCLFMAP